MYIFRVTNQQYAGRLLRSVSHGVYIFIPNDLLTRLFAILVAKHSVRNTQVWHDSPYFHQLYIFMDMKTVRLSAKLFCYIIISTNYSLTTSEVWK